MDRLSPLTSLEAAFAALDSLEFSVTTLTATKATLFFDRSLAEHGSPLEAKSPRGVVLRFASAKIGIGGNAPEVFEGQLYLEVSRLWYRAQWTGKQLTGIWLNEVSLLSSGGLKAVQDRQLEFARKSDAGVLFRVARQLEKDE